jgi:hypothetical protein
MAGGSLLRFSQFMQQPISFAVKRFRPRRYQPGNLKTWSGHLPFARDLVASVRPSVLVELGTHFGESYFGLCQAVEENGIDCRCYSVDTWKGDEHSGFYEEDVFNEVNRYNSENYSSFSFLLRDTFDRASSQFETGGIDLLHIDGLHTYEAVKNDFETWLPKMRAGGIVLMHDIHARHASFGVWRLWDELKSLYPSFDFVHSWGLGVLQIGSATREQPELLRVLFSSLEAERHTIREQYVMAAENLEFTHLLGHAHSGAGRAKPSIQIFAGRHGGFKEEHSARAWIEPGLWQRHLVSLEQGCELDVLRIDLADCPGVIHVAGITVRRSIDGAVIFQIANPAAIRSLRCFNDLLALPCKTEAKFLSYGPDPQLIVEWGRLNELSQPLTVEVWMRLQLELTEIAELLRGSRALATRAPEVSIEPVVETWIAASGGESSEAERLVALAQTETLRAELRHQQTERLVLTSECRRLVTAKQDMEAQNEYVRECLRREQDLRIDFENSAADLRAEVAQLKWAGGQHAADLKLLRPFVDSLEEKVRALEAEVSDKELLGNALEAKLSHEQLLRNTIEERARVLSEELAQDRLSAKGLRKELQEERRCREHLENSYSWRVTEPLRRVLRLFHFRGAGAPSPR